MNPNQMIETWEIHNRINLYLLDAIKEEQLTDIAASKGRTVGEQFAHIHNENRKGCHHKENIER